MPPDPQRKGTDSLWLMWTPSSPHFTLRVMISATPIRQESEPAPKPPSPKAKSSPSPSSPAGPASRQRAGLLPLRPEQPHRCLPYALPTRSQFNRLVRSCTQLIEAFFLHLVSLLEVRKSPYEALDSSAMPIRDCKRRGHGWLAGDADIGWSNSIGWYEGFRACSPPLTLPESSPASALGPLPPPTSRWPRPSSPQEPIPTKGSSAWVRLPRDLT